MMNKLKYLIAGILTMFTFNVNANVINVPETGETFSMLGMGMLGIGIINSYKKTQNKKV